MSIRVIGLDGDDTLWHSESHFAVTQERFRQLLSPYAGGNNVDERLLEAESSNLRLFGYGVKGFILSMIETAIQISGERVTAREIQTIIDAGKELLEHPVELLEGVRSTLEELAHSYELMLITKGDLFHQESKVAGSALGEYLSAIEIVSEKDQRTYQRILQRHGIAAHEFLMVGNSLRSDILPVIAVGARAIHIPYHITWQHEQTNVSEHEGFLELASIADLPRKVLEFEHPPS